jgi:release factor glutamine methyltransferase
MNGAGSSLKTPITAPVDDPPTAGALSSAGTLPTAGAPSTVAAALQRAAQMLRGLGDSPRLDAEILLGLVLGVSRSTLIVRGADPVSAETQRAYDELIARRMQGAPVAYLTGTREFWSLELDVTPDVLVPRPETEVLVELALGLLPKDVPRSVLDLGTGSGAIALAIASERPLVRLTGVDVSEQALAVARANSRRLGLMQIRWRAGSWFQAVRNQRFDMIVSNPPYVASDDPALLRLAAEPALALSCGPTGLEAFDSITDGAAQHLNPGGWLLLEHGNAQADDVARMLECCGFDHIRSHADYSGNARVTLGAIQRPLQALHHTKEHQ